MTMYRGGRSLYSCKRNAAEGSILASKTKVVSSATEKEQHRQQ